MEDNGADIGDALDGLDDFLQDENLFQDLEDLGKVLDELNEADDGGESSDAGESGGASKRDFEFDPDELPGIDDILGSATKTSQAEELEDGEISEVDEKNELKELKKRKMEVINKMRKLVKHKIQLTNQRNDLLLQLQSNTQLDKVTTLLKENSQLVKAISNQIFRMNPEIKVLNGKIKELEASIGVETDDSKDQKIEPTPPQGFTASRKDLENIENFFNRFPNTTVKNKNEVEVGKVKKEEKEAIRRFISLDENSGPSKISSMEPNRDTSAKSLLPSSKSHRLAFDESKIKKMFEKACEITEKTQATSSSNTSGNSSRFVEKKVTSTFDNRKESPSNTKRSSDSIENSIDKRLKEIRLQSSKTPSKIDMVDLTLGDQEKPKRKISPIRMDRGRISPIRLDKGHSLSDSLERQSKKRKSIADQGFVDPSLASVKVKDTESPVASNISKSLLERLGSVPAKEKSSPITLNDSGNGESDGYHPDVTSPREVVSGERKSFWCQHCSRSFIAVQAYISHLESPRHLKVAMVSLLYIYNNLVMLRNLYTVDPPYSRGMRTRPPPPTNSQNL
ncbi:early endosome antigen 1-like [Macrobrachium nipponense]|uniref:early endosome antigen 1-like n=1 Tax=Macrobrachium nipponense TaxID=159736 RepID=UPI0030C87C98